MPLFAREILETCLYVDDLAAARQFYTSVLGLEVIDEQADRHLFLRCGQRMLLLFLPAACRIAGGMLPPHGADGAGHCAFACSEAEFSDWAPHLERQGVAVEAQINWPHGAKSLYFRDPAGNSLEIATPQLWDLDEAKTLGIAEPNY